MDVDPAPSASPAGPVQKDRPMDVGGAPLASPAFSKRRRLGGTPSSVESRGSRVSSAASLASALRVHSSHSASAH